MRVSSDGETGQEVSPEDETELADEEAQEEIEEGEGISTLDAAAALRESKLKWIGSVSSAVALTGGLALSGMVRQSKNFGFLNFALIPHGLWDPTLMLVMAGGVTVSFISYQFVPDYSFFSKDNTLACPLVAKDFQIPNRTEIDLKLIGGAVLFGIGWGMAGICPGPALMLAASGVQVVVYCYMPSYFVGFILASFL
jgi:uncharacterized membrane protein YedE/YeeE